MSDVSLGVGPEAQVGDLVTVDFECRLSRGEVLFSSEKHGASQIRVGARDVAVGIEQGVIGMRAGGVREVRVPPQLAHIERQSMPDLPETAVLFYTLRVQNVLGSGDVEK